MTRKCRQCKNEIPKLKDANPVQKKGFCNFDCITHYAHKKAKDQIAKKERKELRQRKESIKTRSDHAKEAQTEFNRFIRLRDHNEPCISCGRYHNGQYHAGHYRSVGACPELRFNDQNVHKQCSVCNNHLSANLVEYRIRLLNKIGKKAVEYLEGPHEPKKYTIEQLKEIKARYRRMGNELQKDIDGR